MHRVRFIFSFVLVAVDDMVDQEGHRLLDVEVLLRRREEPPNESVLFAELLELHAKRPR